MLKTFTASVLLFSVTLSSVNGFAASESAALISQDAVETGDRDEVFSELADSRFEISLEDSASGSCLADYQTYHRKMAWKAGLALPIGLAAEVVSIAIGGMVGGALGRAADGGAGWSELGGVIVGVVFAGSLGAVSYVVVQTDALVRLVRSGTMKKVIEQAYRSDQGSEPGKNLSRFYKRMVREYPGTSKFTISEMAHELVQMDQDRVLCDGSIKKNQRHRRNPKLKHLLAVPSEARKAVAEKLLRQAE